MDSEEIQRVKAVYEENTHILMDLFQNQKTQKRVKLDKQDSIKHVTNECWHTCAEVLYNTEIRISELFFPGKPALMDTEVGPDIRRLIVKYLLDNVQKHATHLSELFLDVRRLAKKIYSSSWNLFLNASQQKQMVSCIHQILIALWTFYLTYFGRMTSEQNKHRLTIDLFLDRQVWIIGLPISSNKQKDEKKEKVNEFKIIESRLPDILDDVKTVKYAPKRAKKFLLPSCRWQGIKIDATDAKRFESEEKAQSVSRALQFVIFACCWLDVMDCPDVWTHESVRDMIICRSVGKTQYQHVHIQQKTPLSIETVMNLLLYSRWTLRFVWMDVPCSWTREQLISVNAIEFHQTVFVRLYLPEEAKISITDTPWTRIDSNFVEFQKDRSSTSLKWPTEWPPQLDLNLCQVNTNFEAKYEPFPGISFLNWYTTGNTPLDIGARLFSEDEDAGVIVSVGMNVVEHELNTFYSTLRMYPVLEIFASPRDRQFLKHLGAATLAYRLKKFVANGAYDLSDEIGGISGGKIPGKSSTGLDRYYTKIGFYSSRGILVGVVGNIITKCTKLAGQKFTDQLQPIYPVLS